MTRRDICLDCGTYCGDDDPTCGDCGNSKCTECLTSAEWNLYFTKYIKFTNCEMRKYPGTITCSKTDPRMAHRSAFQFDNKPTQLAFNKIYKSFNDFEDTVDYVQEDVFTCEDCVKTNKETLAVINYIKYLEGLLTGHSVPFVKEQLALRSFRF